MCIFIIIYYSNNNYTFECNNSRLLIRQRNIDSSKKKNVNKLNLIIVVSVNSRSKQDTGQKKNID